MLIRTCQNLLILHLFFPLFFVSLTVNRSSLSGIVVIFYYSLTRGKYHFKQFEN